MLNQNQKRLKNKALKIDIGLVICTIIIPIAMKILKIDFNITIVPLFIILFIFFYYLNFKVHQFYLENVENNLNKINNIKMINNLKKEEHKKLKIFKVFAYGAILLFVGISLYIVGNKLNSVLSNLCNIFEIPEQLVGCSLGIITSIPELITFFESQKEYKRKENRELGVIEATNNLLTSNVLNLFIIQTISIIIFVIVW